MICFKNFFANLKPKEADFWIDFSIILLCFFDRPKFVTLWSKLSRQKASLCNLARSKENFINTLNKYLNRSATSKKAFNNQEKEENPAAFVHKSSSKVHETRKSSFKARHDDCSKYFSPSPTAQILFTFFLSSLSEMIFSVRV